MATRRRDRTTDQFAAADGVPAFSLAIHPAGDRVVVELHGELDLFSTRPVRERVTELVGAGFAEVVLDLRGLTFIDSTGMRLLLALNLQARQDGWSLSLIRGPESVQRVFRIAGTAAVLPFAEAPQG